MNSLMEKANIVEQKRTEMEAIMLLANAQQNTVTTIIPNFSFFSAAIPPVPTRFAKMNMNSIDYPPESVDPVYILVLSIFKVMFICVLIFVLILVIVQIYFSVF
jgi:hypothetical protein